MLLTQSIDLVELFVEPSSQSEEVRGLTACIQPASDQFETVTIVPKSCQTSQSNAAINGKE